MDLFPPQPDYSATMGIDQWSLPGAIAEMWPEADYLERRDIDRMIERLRVESLMPDER
ncbi:hypothetical protein QH494_02590 [Sphingomonas sp. AR_OL41]|uniref:hypothetical protein n=1 Tax=Sphingomonas sp. AR_OL41 TaxID=3042729 RepID=UPI002480A638|nr:hypothetical protein [Sphingomonas sp. AR_OL41]MDH7971057.1 hypothetical protein [Sphingomonas sp. AR_OL41]